MARAIDSFPDVPSRRSWRRIGWRIVRIPLFVYLGLTLVLAAFQTNLIFPGRSSQGKPEARFVSPTGSERVHLTTADGTPIVALFGPALAADGQPREDAASRPTVLFFYGNGMCLASSLEEFELFRRLGANVLIPEYPGYGLSGGSPGERSCYQAADASYRHLLGRRDVDPDRIVAAGWSIGGAVAIDLASREPVAGLIALSTFTSLARVAAIHMPFLPHRLLLRHRFESGRKIGKVRAPILLGHGMADRIVPAFFLARLAELAGKPVDRVEIDGAEHNDFFDLGGAKLANALRRFLDRVADR